MKISHYFARQVLAGMSTRKLAVAAAVVVVVLIVARRARDRFIPIPELVCGPYPAPEYAIDVTGRGAAGTVVWEPFCGAKGGGKRSKAQFMAASRATPVPQPAMKRAMGLATLVRRSPSELSRDKRATCVRAITDTDSDVVSDAVSDSTTLCETMTTAPAHAGPDLLKMGLGSTWRDPRFQPGPQQRYLGGGGYGPAPGTHAGGDTLGALTPGTFFTPGAWSARWAHGFGDRFGPTVALAGSPVPYEALITASE